MNFAWRTLRKLQGLPDEKKKVVSLLGASVCTLMILCGWVVLTLSGNNPEFAKLDEKENVSDQAASVIGPWEAVTTQLADIITNARGAISSLKNRN